MTTTWTTLTGGVDDLGSVANWVRRSDLPVDQILDRAQQWIFSTLRAQEMIKQDLAFALAKGDDTAQMPADALESISIRFWNDDPLEKKIQEEFSVLAQRDDTGALPEGSPTVYTETLSPAGTGGTYYFDTRADENKTGSQWYYHRPANLSAGNPTNFLCTKYLTLLMMTCIFMGYQHNQDWAAARDTQKEAIGWINQANVEADLHMANASIDNVVRY